MSCSTVRSMNFELRFSNRYSSNNFDELSIDSIKDFKQFESFRQINDDFKRDSIGEHDKYKDGKPSGYSSVLCRICEQFRLVIQLHVELNR